MIFPRVKKEIQKGGMLSGAHVRVISTEACGSALRAYELLLPDLSFSESAGDWTMSLSIDNDLSPVAEAYEINVDADGVRICAKDDRGLIHAAATLSGRLQVDSDGVPHLPYLCISDAPDTEFRSLMLDPARNRIPMDEVRATVIAMARARLNRLHLHLSDSTGFAFLSKAYPDLPVSPGGAYTREELDEIISLCASLGIDVIPEIDVPAHAFALCDRFPHLMCHAEEANGWNLCLGNEECYRIIDTLLSEIAEIFPYEYIHLGTDEMDMRDLTDTRPFSFTEQCTVCNAFFAPMGLHTIRERFYWFVRRMYRTVTSLGKKMMMWNDDIDISRDPDIPHDILIEFWRVAAEERGPVTGCSMQGFIDAGFDVINADFPNAYLDEYVTFEGLCKWDPLHCPATSPRGRVKGGEICLWEGSNYPHFLYAVYFALPLFGDRLWNCESLLAPSEETKQSLSRACLGASVPADVCLFDHLDGVPLGEGLVKKENIFAKGLDKEAFRAHLDALTPREADSAQLLTNLKKMLS